MGRSLGYRTLSNIEVKRVRTMHDTRILHELTVGEVAKRSGVPVSTLHFYEGKGLIRSRRTSGNQRRYGRDVLRRVAIIKVAQRTGIPLASIRDALATLPAERTPTAKDWHRLSTRWHDALEHRIAALIGLRDQLEGCIGCGCLSMRDCPLRNPYDALAEEGPGARLLDPECPSKRQGPASSRGLRTMECNPKDDECDSGNLDGCRDLSEHENADDRSRCR